MKPAIAAFLGLGLTAGVGLGGCAPYPTYPYPPPTPVVLAPGLLDECTVIRREIVRQERIAEQSGVMSSLLVEGSARLNAANVIIGLQQRAAIAGCPA
jgi:hypothetical protein